MFAYPQSQKAFFAKLKRQKKKLKKKQNRMKKTAWLFMPGFSKKCGYKKLSYMLGKRSVISEINKLGKGKLRYHNFLKTPYWKTISRHMRFKFKNCQFCGGTGYLQVHHKKYDDLGKEHFDLSDLVVLCKSCHLNEHAPYSEESVKQEVESINWI